MSVLERAGFELELPREQTCCGQLHFNTGHVAEAAVLARRFVDVFAGYHTVISPSGSCAAHVRTHIPQLLPDDRGVPARTRELSEFLIEQVGAVDVGSSFHGSLVYHPTCHSLRLLRLGDGPLSLLRAVPGVELLALTDAEECCGFGGAFAVKNAEVSAAMLEAKLENIVASGADAVCALRRVLPHAHRRRAPPPGLARSGRSSRGGAGRVTQAERAARPEPFPRAAREALASRQMRANVLHATTTIRAKRALAVDEVPDWEELRDAGAAIKDHALLSLERLLVDLEAAVTTRGGVVHWARDAAEANAIVAELVRAEGASEVVKVKSLATDEIGLNEALEAAGIRPLETDLAELIVQLAGERPSHLLVPAIHKNRTEIRDLFRQRLGLEDLTDDPGELTAAARAFLRDAFLRARVAVSGANFACADTGSVVVVESEGNGRMCTTLSEVLVTVMGIEKVVASFRDLEVMLQLLPRSSTGERMNPYTSIWSGVHAGDGPRAFHLVLLDNGRTQALADEVGRDALRCIRCSACINVCPVYRQTGGHAYHTPYAGPIGAILQPQLDGERGVSASLPFASTLCGACADVCPVRIDIPALLVHERAKVVAARRTGAEDASLKLVGRVFRSRAWYERSQRLARLLAKAARAQRVVPALPAGPVARVGAQSGSACGPAADVPGVVGVS